MLTLSDICQNVKNKAKKRMNFVHLVSVIICFCFFNCNVKILKAMRRCTGRALFRPRGSRNYRKLNHDLKETLPSNFECKMKWPHCNKSFSRISDQGNCGGCWAFAASSVMNDRLCIYSDGKVQDYVSAQDLLECCKNCVKNGSRKIDSCEGGYPDEAFAFWKRVGIVSGYDHSPEGCKPTNRETIKGKSHKTCRRECTNKKYKKSYNDAKIFGSDFFVQYDPFKNNLQQIKLELFTNGPILAFINTYEYFGDFGNNSILFYDKNKVKKDEKPVIHAVKILGWEEVVNCTPVWVIANSWGTNWCNSGFCWIKRGVNELNIEGFPMMGGLPSRSAVMKGTKLKSSGSSTICLTSLVIILTVILLFHFL